MGSPKGRSPDRSLRPDPDTSQAPSLLEEGLERVVRHACEWTGSPAGLLLWEEAGRLHPLLHIGLEGIALHPFATSTSPEAKQVDLPTSLQEAHPHWSHLPLCWQDQRLGWLLLGGPTPVPESMAAMPRQLRYLNMLALVLVCWNEAAGREQRLASTEEQARQRDLIQHISALVNSTVDLEEIFRITVHETVKAFEVDHSGILLFDEEKQYGQVVAEYPPRGVQGSKLPVEGYRAAEQILLTGEPVVIEDVRHDPRVGPARPLMNEMGLRSIMILPLIVEGEVLGSIGLDVLGSPRAFSPEEIATAQTVANQVAVAIGRARLYQDKAVSEEHFRSLVEQAHDFIWTLDRQGKLTFANRLAEEITGYSLDDWRGRTLGSMIIAEDMPQVQRAYGEALAGQGQSCEVRIRDAQGRTRYLLVNITPLREREQIVGTLSFGRDITARKEAEGALLQRTLQAEKRAALLRAIGEVSRQVLSLLDRPTLLQLAVDSLVRNLGYDVANVLLLENDVLVMQASAGKAGRALRGRRLRLDEGITGWVAAYGEPYLSNDVLRDNHYYYAEELSDTRSEVAVPIHRTTGIAGVLDVQSMALDAFDEADLLALTSLADQLGIALENACLYNSLRERMAELERTRARLSQAERLSALSEMIANAAHELNNPLTAVVGYAQLVKDSIKNPEIRQDLLRILREGQRATRIVEDLLTFGRQREPKFRAIDVNDFLQQTLRREREILVEENVDVAFLPAPDLPPTRADPNQLEPVVRNLLQNARQAITEGPGQGRVTIRTSHATAEAPAGEWVCIEVSDNGPGISAEDLPRVFDPFFTTREGAGGTGLGLSICYGIVVKHGGRIWAESEPGQGAHFFIELPAWSPDEGKGARSADPLAPGTGRGGLP